MSLAIYQRVAQAELPMDVVWCCFNRFEISRQRPKYRTYVLIETATNRQEHFLAALSLRAQGDARVRPSTYTYTPLDPTLRLAPTRTAALTY